MKFRSLNVVPNVNETVIMYFGSITESFEIMLDSISIECMTSTKLLGIEVHRKLVLNTGIVNSTSKLSSSVFVISQLLQSIDDLWKLWNNRFRCTM